MYSIDHHDLGTPEASGAPINLEIDGRPVTVPAGTSIMRAAALTGCGLFSGSHPFPEMIQSKTI